MMVVKFEYSDRLQAFWVRWQKRPAARAPHSELSSASKKPKASSAPDDASADWQLEFADGDCFLARCAKEMLSKLTKKDRGQLSKTIQAFRRHGGAFVVSSACSGSEVQAFAGRELFCVLSCGDSESTCKVRFACEKQPNKITWIKQVAKHLGHDPCIFEDYGSLASDTAECKAHPNRTCFISVGAAGSLVILHTAGFSCKELSKAKSSSTQKQDTILQERAGSTGSTFDDLIAHLHTHMSLI